MSNLYSDLTLTSFPEAVDDIDRIVDVTNDMIIYVKQYNAYCNAGNLTAAQQLITDHPQLKQMFIGASTMNPLIDAIKAIERFYFSDVQQYLVDIVQPRGLWNASVKYAKYNTVQYVVNGIECTYMCMSTNCPVGTLPTNSSYWIGLTLTGAQGASGIGLSPRGQWNGGTYYYNYDMVSYNNCLWGSLFEGNSNICPSESNSNWFLVMDFSGNDITYSNGISGLSATTVQGAIDELNEKTILNTNKLNGIEAGAQVNTVTGVKGSLETDYRTGNINITKANIGLGNVDNTSDANKSVSHANTSDSAINADMVDNTHVVTSLNTSGLRKIIASTTDLLDGVSALQSGTIYLVFED